jgi:hypothetical protein
MQIKAATMGGKMVIGGKWLHPDTKLAIVAAFGAEGTEVIRKTNDYLNRIATTDPQRALLLAGFINEDPLLVCSLVETSKTRWLKSDGLARFTIPYKPNQDSHITAIYQVESLAANLGYGVAIFGSAQAWKNNGFETLLPVNNETTCYFVYGSNPFNFSMKTPFNKTLKIDANGVNWVWENVEDNVTLQTHTFSPVTFSSPNDLGIFNNYRGAFDTNVYPIIKISSVTVDDLHSLVPCQHGGENGMLDIISGTFHPNANTQGSFTIAITHKTPA